MLGEHSEGTVFMVRIVTIPFPTHQATSRAQTEVTEVGTYRHGNMRKTFAGEQPCCDWVDTFTKAAETASSTARTFNWC